MLIGGRMGVESFFDARILAMSKQQNFAFNLLEIIKGWAQKLTYWDEGVKTWSGTASDLIEALTSADTSPNLLKDWNASRVARALATLARVGGTGVDAEGTDRKFRITKAALNKTNNEEMEVKA